MNDKVVLLVEDNRDDELLTVRALRKAKIANPVVVAHDGVEALDYLFARGPHEGRGVDSDPQLVLLDLKLPRLDGLEVLRALREHPRTKYQPVVVLTTSQEDGDIVASYRNGANSFLRKPVDFDQFIAAAHTLNVYWLLLNTPVPVGGA